MQLVLRDVDQGPYLSKVLIQGQADETLSGEQLSQIKSKAILMSLKLADKFYNKYKMHLLEQAAHDVIGVVSLGLMELSNQNPQQAIRLLITADGVVKCFQKAGACSALSASTNSSTASHCTVMSTSSCLNKCLARQMQKNG